MKRFVAIDLSRAYLLARFSFESRKVIDDNWLGSSRRAKAAAMYIEVGKDFNRFFLRLGILPAKLWYSASVRALETFRDNLDVLWAYAYSGNMRKIIWLNKDGM